MTRTNRAQSVAAEPQRRPHILIVAYHFPPEGSIGTHRTLRLVRHLVERGWDVTVLTGTRATYSAGCSIDLDLLSRVPGAVRVVRAPVWRPFERLSALLKKAPRPAGEESSTAHEPSLPNRERRFSAVRRSKQRFEGLLRIPDAHVGWILPAIAAGLFSAVRQSPDVLYSSSPPWTGQLVARTLAAALGCPWVADFRDPWARAPWRDRWMPTARRAAELFERWVVGRADAVVFTTRTNMVEYAGFYGAGTASKFHLVRNGCDRDEFQGVTPSIRDPRFTLLHAGSLYGGRKPSALLSALAALRDRGVISADSFCFRQIGRVGLKDFDMEAERRRLALDGLVEISPSLPRREILREMCAASCLLLLQPGTTVSIPGKLFEYFAAGRPILALAELGETATLVRAGGGVATLPDDQPAIERAIQTLIQTEGQPWERPSLDLFDGTLRTRELVSVLEKHVSSAARRISVARESNPEV